MAPFIEQVFKTGPDNAGGFMRYGWFLFSLVLLPLSLLVLLVQPLSAFQPSVKNTILAGTVTFESKFGDRPAADYLISFQKTDCESCMYSARTNAQGKFRVEVPPGSYQIVAQERAPTGEMKDLIPPGQLQVIEVNGFQVNCDIRLTMPHVLQEILKCVQEQQKAEIQQIEPAATSISLAVLGYSSHLDRIVLEITNQSARTFFYDAYSPETPIYKYQSNRGGYWRTSVLAFCGTGLGTAGLKGNSSQKIYLSPYEFPNGGNVKLRICITGWFSEKPYDIWTQPFKVKNLPGYHHE
ncbi:MAG TPA: carboxypeptidase-like regulatory domain-containing protein [Acidobacteriota bacterium]|nr:carboxypeptidase-like regulatory domain-containing protein [Acidobacteriota bacterium]